MDPLEVQDTEGDSTSVRWDQVHVTSPSVGTTSEQGYWVPLVNTFQKDPRESLSSRVTSRKIRGLYQS